MCWKRESQVGSLLSRDSGTRQSGKMGLQIKLQRTIVHEVGLPCCRHINFLSRNSVSMTVELYVYLVLLARLFGVIV